MALWVCSGEAGCTTKYAVGLSRCPRCHNTEFHEDGAEPVAKISKHGGASDVTLPVPDAVVRTDEPLSEEQVEQLREAVAAGAEPLPFGATVQTAKPDEDGGEEPSPGSSSETSTEKPSTPPEPSSKPRRKPARTTVSRSSKAQTETSSASSTDGGPAADTSAADSSKEA